MGVPASFWTGLDNELKSVADAAMAKLTEAGVVMVDEDIEGVMELNSKCSFPIIWHDSIEFLETYLQVCSPGTTVRDVADQVASPDVKHLIFEVLQDSFDPILYEEAKNLHLPALRALYEQYIKRNKLDAIIFPTTIIQAPSIDLINGSSVLKDNLLIRNTDPGSNACIPGLSIPVGLTPDGLPVGLAIDGPVGSDPTLLRIGLSMEMLLGSLPFPSLLEEYT
jgi:mandelamide amidase